jgi:EmrB/QacA subfamily drug resistance transporter
MILESPSPAAVSETVKRLLPWLVAVAFFMESLDTTILNTAVPSIAAALQVAPLSMKAVLSSYTLSVAVFVPISGWLADRFGTRHVFSGAIALFTLGSLFCGLSSDIHVLVASRILQGLGGAMMVPVGRLTLVRTFPKTELIRAMTFVAMPALIGPMIGPVAGGFIVNYLHWRAIFFVNLPVGLIGLYLVWHHLPDYSAEHYDPLDWVGLLLFSSGLALLSYVLEIFGEHSLSGGWIVALIGLSLGLLLAYGRHAMTTTRPLLRLSLFAVRTFRAAGVGSFVTRIGAGGVPFLLPLLYQTGLGFSPVQSALLILPQPVAALSLKFLVPTILKRFGYRKVLISNTLLMGAMIGMFSTIGLATPVALIVAQAFVFGFSSSLQYSSMNTLVYADIPDRDASMASTLASTLQQMSMSFGVAAASLTAALFLPDRFNSTAPQMIQGIHLAFLTLGAMTLLSTAVFASLRASDGATVSHRAGDALAHAGVQPGDAVR